MKGDFKTRLTERLKQMTPEYNLILESFFKDTVLCGGLVLQVALDEYWETDIDLFTTKDDLKSIGDHPFRVYPRGCTMIPGVKQCYSGVLENNASMDIIHITSLADLFSGFDFDFCKIWYDGTSLHMINREAVETKSCTVNVDADHMRKPEERIKKYRQRGFKIKFLE